MPAVAVTTVGSDAYGVSANVNLTVLPALGGVSLDATAGPINAVDGTAGPAYAMTGTVASGNNNLDLGIGAGNLFVGIRQQLNTGLLTSTAQSPFPANQSGSARSVVDNLGFTLGADASVFNSNLLSLLGIGADTIVSRSAVTGGSVPAATGFTSIEGLTLGGSLFSQTVINNAAAGLYINPDVDTLLLGVDVLGERTLSIVLNEQVKATGATSASITTNAIHIIFSNYVLAGVGTLRGDVIIGHTHAFIENASSATPEPAVWAQMITGFGLIGFVTRRRRVAAAA